MEKTNSKLYRTVDLCAGIGGIRRGFELAGFKNVLSAEVDEWACNMYEHLFGDNPKNDLTSEEFKKLVEAMDFDVLLAGFPCQTFSIAGARAGFDDTERGQIFFHIAEIIERARPIAFFLENVGHLTTHDKGQTFKTIIKKLSEDLNYKIIGVSTAESGEIEYKPKDFIRNSKDFGVPQNRPRTYIIGFDRDTFSPEVLDKLSNKLPTSSLKKQYDSLLDVLEKDVDPKYYMASGYLKTLEIHKEREKNKGNGFGHKIVNSPEIEKPIANTLLATGGSGKERNLIIQHKKGIARMTVKGKKTPLNDKGIRVMTPTEWGRLQGFIDYAFVNEECKDEFSFLKGMRDSQKYKQFGNSVTIQVIKEMADFVHSSLELLSESENRRSE